MLYIDALWNFYNGGSFTLTDEQYDRLREELNWQGEKSFWFIQVFPCVLLCLYLRCPFKPSPRSAFECELSHKSSTEPSPHCAALSLLCHRARTIDVIGLVGCRSGSCVPRNWLLRRSRHIITVITPLPVITSRCAPTPRQGSGFPTLRRYEVNFVNAAIAYARGESVVTDEEYEAGGGETPESPASASHPAPRAPDASLDPTPTPPNVTSYAANLTPVKATVRVDVHVDAHVDVHVR
jgi:hypothetical protein